MSQPLDLTEIPEGLRSGYNGTGTDIGANLFVTGKYSAVTLPGAITAPVIGVTRNAGITDKKYGSIATRGLVLVKVGSGGVTAGQRVGPDASTGRAIPVAPGSGVNAAVAGVCHTTQSEDEYTLVELGVGSMMQGA